MLDYEKNSASAFSDIRLPVIKHAITGLWIECKNDKYHSYKTCKISPFI